MEILIKGMDMPDSCFLCRFCRRQEYGEYVGEDTAWSCVASKKRITDGQDLIATFKHPDCPLVEAAEVTDAVSRQQAIDALDKILPADPMKNDYTQGITVGAALAIEYIKQLPSAQPEIIRCNDCMHNGSFDTDCPIDWAGKDYCNFAERRTDE